jgi:AraC family transcriptional regulator
MFQPPAEVYGARVSEAGSLCLTVDIDPAVLEGAFDTLHSFDHFSVARRLPPHWLAFQLRREIEISDDLSTILVADIVLALLMELDDRPSLEARTAPLPWLERVREQIDDEFHRHHTLESLAQTAGVHHVHLARDFRRRFGCTVGHYIRQRRVEFACHRLTSSWRSLSEIALDAGFADQSHFTNTFRQLVGMPPGAFRARFLAPTRQLSA